MLTLCYTVIINKCDLFLISVLITMCWLCVFSGFFFSIVLFQTKQVDKLRIIKYVWWNRLRLFRHFDPFRILVCSGDGSVGWVLSEIDRLGMHVSNILGTVCTVFPLRICIIFVFFSFSALGFTIFFIFLLSLFARRVVRPGLFLLYEVSIMINSSNWILLRLCICMSFNILLTLCLKPFRLPAARVSSYGFLQQHGVTSIFSLLWIIFVRRFSIRSSILRINN